MNVINILPLIYPSNNPSICLPGARVYQDADHSGQDAASLQRGSARPASFQREHRVRPFWYAANAGVWQIALSHGKIHFLSLFIEIEKPFIKRPRINWKWEKLERLAICCFWVNCDREFFFALHNLYILIRQRTWRCWTPFIRCDGNGRDNDERGPF